MKRRPRIMMVFLTLALIFQWAGAVEIHEAARSGDLEKIKALVDSDPTLINAKDENGRTPLHWAARGVHFNAIKYLVERGADVNAQDVNLVTPLHSVAVRNHGEAVKLLIDKGARVDVPDYEKHTALHLAAQSGAKDAVAVLAKNGSALELKDDYGRTPLVLGARERGGPDVARILLEAGANVNALDKSGSSALELAAWRGYRDVVDILLDNKADIPIKGPKGRATLMFSAERGLSRLFQKMVAQGADVSVPNSKNGTLLHDAAAGGSPEIIAGLIEKGLDVNGKDRYGWAPSHYAARDGRREALDMLISKGADINVRTLMGQSPFNLAAENGFDDLKKLLMAKGCDQKPIQFPPLEGDYLGQKPPGEKPEIFALGIVSSIWGLHSTVAFSPDGNEAFWSPMIVRPGAAYSSGGLFVMKRVNGRWTPPEEVSFPGVTEADVPFFSPNGKRLYFISDRALFKGGQSGKENIWFVERLDNGWSEPRPADPAVNALEMHWQFSVDKAGNIFFGSGAAGGKGMSDIYCSRFENGRYAQPENLGDRINTVKDEATPFIAPDGSYLIFNRAQDLFISFRQKDGTWTEAVNLGPSINTLSYELCPIVTSDGKYLFFVSSRNGEISAWWVDAKIIGDLKPKDLK